MKLKIGAAYYTVQVVPQKELDEGDSADCDTDTMLIRITDRAKPEAFRANLLHEALHTINASIQDEAFIEFLAQAITQLLAENPHFTKLFLKGRR